MVLIFALILFTISIVFFSIKTGISPMPTSGKTKKRLFAILPQEVRGKIYELGAGWGTIVVPLVQKYSNMEVIGYELSFFPWLIACLRVWLAKNRANPSRVLREDFFNANLQGAKVVFCYLYPGAMEKLKKKFEKELSADTLVVSNSFQIPGWSPVEIIPINDLFFSKIYIYKVLS